MAFFDNRIIDADAPSYVCSNTSWQALANRAAQQKPAKYQHVIEDLRGSFTPFVCSHRDPCMHVRLWRGRPLNTRTLPIGVSTATSDYWPAVLARNLVILSENCFKFVTL